MGGFKKLKTKVVENISWVLPAHSREEAIKRATSATLTYCKGNGKYKTNKTRPIAITFLNHKDQDFLLRLKKLLPIGIYVDEEYPSEVRIARAKLWPISSM